jgi:outer membrane lipoprotein-sorting protein
VSFLRRLSTRSLVVLIAAVCTLAIGGAAIAVAAGGGGSAPPPKPLDQALADALAAKPPDGVTARVTFTNKLFPSGALFGQVGSALMSGASGRLWLTNDGRGRIELQSDAGDVQVVWDDKTVTVYDASSNTVYRADLSAPGQAGAKTAGAGPSLAEIDSFLAGLGEHWSVSDAQPTVIAGRPAYRVSVAPKHDGGLLASVALAWDAEQGVPLEASVDAQGSGSPVLALTVTDVSYGAVPDSDVDIAPPAGAKVVDLGSGPHPGDRSGAGVPAVSGLDAVQAAADFPVVAPPTLVGLPRRDVRLVGGDTAVALYGQGLGGIVLVERKTEASSNASGALSALPTVSLDGLTAHELATQLGTVLAWDAGGTSFVLAGSQPAAAAEAAARAVK